jgi:hypothetical protein
MVAALALAVLYCTKLAQAQTEDEKARIEEDMLGHAEMRHALAVIKGEDGAGMSCHVVREAGRA